MKNLLLTVVSIGSITAALAADTYVDWTSYNDTYSGPYTDVNRWNPQTYGYPGSIAPEETGFVYPLIARWNLIDADFTVTFPEGTTSTPCNFDIFAGPNRVIDFVGTGATWTLPATSANAYRTEAFRVGAGDGNATLYKGWDQWGSIHKEQTVSFDNFKFRVSATNSVRRLDFLSGTFSFTPRTTRFFDGTSTEDMAVTFHSGATASATATTYFGAAGPHNTITFIWQKSFNPYSFSFNGTDATHETTVVLDGTTWTVSGSTYTSASKAKLVLKNASSITGSTADMNQTTANSELDALVTGGSTLRMRKWDAANAAGARSSLVVDGATFNPNGAVTLGGQDAEKIVDSFAGVYVTNSTLPVAVSWTVNSGEIVCGPGTILEFSAGGKLAGGVLGGTSRFLADGVQTKMGWGVQGTASPGAISGFTTAELTENGLTFRYINNYKAVSYVVPQNFKDAAGHEGKGRLAFDQTINAELTGTDSKESVLEVAVDAGYRVTMKDGARHYSNVTVKNGGALCLQGATQTGATFKSLTLGTAATVGVLELDADEPVTVDGPINFVNGQIKFGTTLANGTHTVFKSTKLAQAGSAVTDWMFKKGFTVTAGVAGYYTCKTAEQGGELLFQIVVSDEQPTLAGDVTYDGSVSVWTPTNRAVFAGAAPKAIALADGVDSASMRFTADGYAVSGGKISMSDVTGAAIEAQMGTTAISSDMDFFAATDVNVADGAKLTLGGDILGVGLTKTGAGELEFESPEMTLANGLTLKDGSTSFGAAATYDAKLNIATTDATKPVIVRADEDVTMPIGSVTQGSLIKWGSGKLTLTAKADVTLTLNALNAANVGGTEYDLSDYDGTASKPHGPINVAEGELVIRGTSATRPSVTISCPSDNAGRSYIGIPTADGSVANPKEPGLVIDHANVAFSSRELMMGYGLVNGKTFSRAPYLVVTNGSHLSTRNFNFNGDSMSGTAKTVVYFNNSSMGCNQNYAGAPATNCFTFVNGSSMFNGNNANLGGSVDYSFDRSGWYGGNSNTVQSVFLSSIPNGSVLRYAFRNGSCFAGMFGTTWSGTTSIPIDITFADSEWFGGDADRTLPTTLCNVRTHLEGKGVRVRPPTGRTWTFNQPMTGEGGFTLAGAGTFVFDVNKFGGTARADPLTVCYTGLTDVQAGTLRFTANSLSNFVGRMFKIAGTLDFGGASVTGAVITTAGGTVQNVDLVRPTFAVGYDGEGAVLPVALGGTVSGRAIFDFGAVGGGTPTLPVGTKLTVATWTGTKPDVSKWRSTNVGEGLRCTFEAKDNGDIIATVAYKAGLMLLVR